MTHQLEFIMREKWTYINMKEYYYFNHIHHEKNMKTTEDQIVGTLVLFQILEENILAFQHWEW